MKRAAVTDAAQRFGPTAAVVRRGLRCCFFVKRKQLFCLFFLICVMASHGTDSNRVMVFYKM